MSLGPMEIALIIVVLVLLFGPKKIPELARSLGRATQEFKKAKDDYVAEANKTAEDVKDALKEPESKAQDTGSKS